MMAACVSLAIAVSVAAIEGRAELLPEAPSAWRFERIDFPLPFAPELKYQGFEELRFAPGMFKPDSETYFTYILAMKITNDVSFDEKRLTSLLESYFRGLCRTVAKASKFDIDEAKIVATVNKVPSKKSHLRHFHVSLNSFDPFVTGKPLVLHLDVTVVKVSNTDRRIFAAVSRKPVDSPLWIILRGLKQKFQAATMPTGK